MNTKPLNFDTWHSRLRSARQALHLTRAQLAEMCDVAPGTVQDWEEGRIKRLTAKNAMTVAAKLNVTLEWLVEGQGNPPSAQEIMTPNMGASKNATPIAKLIELASARRQEIIIEPLRLLIAADDANFELMMESLRYLFSIDSKKITRDELSDLLSAYLNAEDSKKKESISLMRSKDR